VHQLRVHDESQLENPGKREVSDGPQAIQGAEQGTYKAGAGLIVTKLPDEVAVPMRREDFQTLCEGGVAESRASRDLCVGIFVGVVVGLVGIFATVDWENVWKPEHRNSFLFWVGLLLVLAAGSGVSTVIFWIRCYRTTTNSPYSRLRDKLLKMYGQQI
jgi:hypothetical protein